MIECILYILLTAGVWKVFEKVRIEGWKVIIPFYNAYVLTVEVAKKPWYYFALLFVPIVNLIILIIINVEVAKAFNKSALYGGVGLTFLPFIFYPILGFGDSGYSNICVEEIIDEIR